MDNKHKIIYELKKLLYETKTISLELMSLHTSKVLDYIYSEDNLKNEYEKQIKEYKKLEANKQFIKDRSEFLGLLNAVCNGTLKNEDSDTVVCSNFVEYTSFILNKLANNVKENFINSINIDTFSIIDFCITLAKYASLNTKLTLSPKNIERLKNFEKYDKHIPFYQLDRSNLNSLFPSSKVYLANVLLLRTSLKLILISLILFLDNNQNIEQPKMTKITSKKCPLNEEHIKILKLRKTLNPNGYKYIAQALETKTSVNNIAQKFTQIKNILGASSPDIAVSIFEQQYYSFDNNQ